jgi:hypothetical protein
LNFFVRRFTILLVAEVPSRAMQIVCTPITKLMHEDKQEESMVTYKDIN